MKVTLQDLDSFGLLENLPDVLKNMSGDHSFVFYYNDTENLKLDIYEYEIVKEVNVSLYRGMFAIAAKHKQRTMHVGYFKGTFETKDGLFYEFLRTYNDAEKVREFYLYAKNQDKIVELNISTEAVNNIYTSDDFRRAISYFDENRLQTIMFCYDMVSHAISRRLSKNLYGGLIKRVVNMVVYSGGVLTEMNGSLRYMVIGEHAILTEEQKEKLETAKMLIRSGQPFDNVYQYTGWSLSPNDGKWRTNIADDKAEILSALLYEHNGRNLYVPSGMTPEETMAAVANPERAKNYKGRLRDVFKHTTLFQHYPSLAIMPLFYYYGERSNVANFYFSPDERGGYIMINGGRDSGEDLSILLHEIQHYVQHQEGYATGGNQELAKFVVAVGSESVRKIFACINRMERYFREYLLADSVRVQMLSVVRRMNIKSGEARGIQGALIEMLSDSVEYRNKYKTINFYLILFIAESGDFSTNAMIDFLEEKIGSGGTVIYELFENIAAGYGASKKYKEQKILEGYQPEDIRIILFKSYENLYGEMEARSVQTSRLVESEFKNYYSLTTWENAPLQQLTVIDGAETIVDVSNIKAAIETKDGQYVLHFKKGGSCIPFIHELGHIVYDALIALGYEERIKVEYYKDVFSNDMDEFFVKKFIGYLKSRIDDKGLAMDLRSEFISEAEDINRVLDEFFTDEGISDRLKFLQFILN